MPMTAVTSPRPASTRCCSPAGRRLPTDTPIAVPASTAATLMNVPVIARCSATARWRACLRGRSRDAGGWQGGWSLTPADVLIVSLGSTAGLRAADEELAGALRRAGASVAVANARPPRELRTYALTDLAWARAARAAAIAGLRAHAPRCVLYSTVTAALLWPRPGAIRYDAPAAANRPGRHGLWQRPLERRRLAAAPLLVPVDGGTLTETPRPHAPAVVVPIAVESSADGASPRRDVAVLTYDANPHKKGLDRILAAWAAVRREDEELVVAGADLRIDAPGVDVA